MRGPIDYIIVGFEGNNFKGDILKALEDASNQGVIAVLALAIVSKDSQGTVTMLDAVNTGDDYLVSFSQNYKLDNSIVDQDDIDEVGELLENNSTAGLLVVEQLWAKPLKKALIDANGVLISEGRIHPDAAEELNTKED